MCGEDIVSILSHCSASLILSTLLNARLTYIDLDTKYLCVGGDGAVSNYFQQGTLDRN